MPPTQKATSLHLFEPQVVPTSAGAGRFQMELLDAVDVVVELATIFCEVGESCVFFY